VEVAAREPGQPGRLYPELHAHISQHRRGVGVPQTLAVRAGVIRVAAGIPGVLQHRVSQIFSGPEGVEVLPISVEPVAGEGLRHQEEAEAELSGYRQSHWPGRMAAGEEEGRRRFVYSVPAAPLAPA
jgi:hypothetical protein